MSQFALLRCSFLKSIPVFNEAVGIEIDPFKVFTSLTSNDTVPLTSFEIPVISSSGVLLKKEAWFLPYLSSKENVCIPETPTLKPWARVGRINRNDKRMNLNVVLIFTP